MQTYTVQPTARDVTINFNDSCNGCCWCCKKEPRDEEQVYITSKGTAKKFSSKKARDEHEAMQRSLSNLQRRIEQVAAEIERDPSETIRRIERVAQVKIKHCPAGSPITFGMVARINRAVSSIKEEARSSKDSLSPPQEFSSPLRIRSPRGALGPPTPTMAPQAKEDSPPTPKTLELQRTEAHRPQSFPTIPETDTPPSSPVDVKPVTTTKAQPPPLTEKRGDFQEPKPVIPPKASSETCIIA